MFSKACEYGIKAAIFIAQKSSEGQRLRVKEIAKDIDSPLAFTSKILQRLVHHQLIQSSRGAQGGFYLPAGKSEQITLAEIVNAIDGDNIYQGCGLGLEVCDEERPCPIHEQFKEIRFKLKCMLENTSLKALVDDLDKGHTVLKF